MNLWQLWKRRDLARELLEEHDYEPPPVDWAVTMEKLHKWQSAYVNSMGRETWAEAVRRKAAEYREDVSATGGAEAS